MTEETYLESGWQSYKATTKRNLALDSEEVGVALPLAFRRYREAYLRQFQLEQMTANEWISFERAVSCLTGQKNLTTADDARRALLDAICAGKIHNENLKALQCLDTAPREDDWFWSVADFRTLVEHREGLESVLKNTYFARDSLLPWMKGCGFEPTADIQSDPLKSALNPNDQTVSPENSEEEPAKSGLPGRPSSKSIYQAKRNERAEAGELADILKAESETKPTRVANRSGAKPQWDWAIEGKSYAEKVFRERGDFSDGLNQESGWASQADFEKLVQAHLKTDDARVRGVPEGKEPGVSTTKEYVAKWLAEWRGQQ
jgi:hypothetical protein